MPASVKKLAHDPIIVIAFEGSPEIDVVVDAYAQSVEIAQKTGEAVYRIVDLRDADSSFADIVAVLREITQGIAGASTPPVLNAAFVGKPHMAAFFAGHNLTFFERLDDAVAHFRSHVAVSAL